MPISLDDRLCRDLRERIVEDHSPLLGITKEHPSGLQSFVDRTILLLTPFPFLAYSVWCCRCCTNPTGLDHATSRIMGAVGIDF